MRFLTIKMKRAHVFGYFLISFVLSGPTIQMRSLVAGLFQKFGTYRFFRTKLFGPEEVESASRNFIIIPNMAGVSEHNQID